MPWGLTAARCPAGCDVVLDPVGGAPFAEAMKVVKWGGQIAIIGFATGTIPKVDTVVFAACVADATLIHPIQRQADEVQVTPMVPVITCYNDCCCLSIDTQTASQHPTSASIG